MAPNTLIPTPPTPNPEIIGTQNHQTLVVYVYLLSFTGCIIFFITDSKLSKIFYKKQGFGWKKNQT
jgi:hypothetical protein